MKNIKKYICALAFLMLFILTSVTSFTAENNTKKTVKPYGSNYSNKDVQNTGTIGYKPIAYTFVRCVPGEPQWDGSPYQFALKVSSKETYSGLAINNLPYENSTLNLDKALPYIETGIAGISPEWYEELQKAKNGELDYDMYIRIDAICITTSPTPKRHMITTGGVHNDGYYWNDARTGSMSSEPWGVDGRSVGVSNAFGWADGGKGLAGRYDKYWIIPTKGTPDKEKGEGPSIDELPENEFDSVIYERSYTGSDVNPEIQGPSEFISPLKGGVIPLQDTHVEYRTGNEPVEPYSLAEGIIGYNQTEDKDSLIKSFDKIFKYL